MPATPLTYLARHGETIWSLSGQHTGRTDLPLTSHGEEEARQLGVRLRSLEQSHGVISLVLTSPLLRAVSTCDLAGFAAGAETDPDLMEWDYGDYEGLRRAEILRQKPDWNLFRDGCPGGESPQQIAARADRVVHRIRQNEGNVLIFSSGHFLRVLASRWLGLDPLQAAHFMLGTASISLLGYDHDLSEPAIRLWNATEDC